jgi:hypothetical protein
MQRCCLPTVGVRLIHAKSGARSTRYLERGLEAALTDDPRLKPPKLLDAKQQAATVALVCGPPSARSRALDHRADRAGSTAARSGPPGWAGDHPSSVCKPRAKAWRERNDGSSSLRPSLKDEILLSL